MKISEKKVNGRFKFCVVYFENLFRRKGSTRLPENNETGIQLCIEIESYLNIPLQVFASSIPGQLPVWY